MKTKAAWIKIGDAFAQYPSKRSQLEEFLTVSGICSAIRYLSYDSISSFQWAHMLNIVRGDVQRHSGFRFDYAYEYFTRKYQLLRASYCYLMAEMEE